MFVRAARSRGVGSHKLYFDVAEAALVASGDQAMQLQIADAIEAVGSEHVLFGSDAVGEFTLSPVKAAGQFRTDVPISQADFDQIAKNRLSFLPSAAGSSDH